MTNFHDLKVRALSPKEREIATETLAAWLYAWSDSFDYDNATIADARIVTASMMAEAASLSPRQFSRIFREETGQSPAKAVEMMRLEAARVMLEEGRHPMDIVARDTGFSDRDRMRRAFLRSYGQPPASLKRSLKLMADGTAA